MLRNLQGTIKNVDAQNKAAVAMKRGMFVNKDVANKKAILPTNVDEIYMVNRGLVNDALLSIAGTLSDYETVLETIKADEFVDLIAPTIGERWATDAFDGVDADFEAGKYLTVSLVVDAKQGKLIASPTNTKTHIKSLGKITDNTHTLVAFEYVA